MDNKEMRLQDLINKLQACKEKRGNRIVRFSVKDHYSTHGEIIEPHWRVDDDFWVGTSLSNEYMMLRFSLPENDGKYPKITYRKP